MAVHVIALGAAGQYHVNNMAKNSLNRHLTLALNKLLNFLLEQQETAAAINRVDTE